MNIESNIQNLFPMPVGMYNFPRPFTQTELEYIRDLEKAKNMGNQKSIDNYALKSDILSEISNFCDTCANEFFHKIYKPKNEISLRITQSWFNYTETGEFHHKHTHPNSFISGVMYIQTDDTKDRIYFFENSYKQFKIPATDFNLYNSDSWWFEAKTGQLLLFPSKMEHMVETRPDVEYTRMSLSFNTFPVGILGTREELTELVL